MAPTSKRTILITGCSDGSLGSHLALAFHNAGWRVFATARNPAKLKTVTNAGIETLQFDTLSSESIKNTVSAVAKLTGGSLDMLLNNAGAGYSMPLLDLDLDKTRDLFELNVYSLITVTRAFLPLLRESETTHGGVRGGIIVNNTSCSSLTCAALPFAGAYNASKAAATSITEVMRLELAPFGIKVVNLLTGGVRSTFHANAPHETLPPNSIFNVAKEAVEKTMSGADYTADGSDPEQWAKQIVGLLSKSNPSYWVWGGKWSTTVWASTFLPVGLMDWITKPMVGLDVVEKKIKEQEKAGKAKPA
ncbi:IBR finger domain protein [Lentithecium fluviatile CBS 122367]|uniref:IBR finger domain protein n=1 Tax=Lentithecium fluviatile CBS 122367 TaxID=1168545 RepID=A0A6G1J4P7_9PLEO|nr:IBR finger domain protein [Lentithecium fluviatile CBS 122367]